MQKKTLITVTTALLLSLSTFAGTAAQQRQFADGDKNADGALSQAEYLTIRLTIMETVAKKNDRAFDAAAASKRLENRFKISDKDGNGKLSEDEFYASVQSKKK